MPKARGDRIGAGALVTDLQPIVGDSVCQQVGGAAGDRLPAGVAKGGRLPAVRQITAIKRDHARFLGRLAR